jgi:hypothetical protein
VKIELKNVSYNARLSEETAAFAADLWIDGKKAGEVRNDGHGGCNAYHPWALAGQIDAYAKTLPPQQTPYGEIEPDADILIGDLLNDYLAAKDLKRAMGRKVLFLRGGKVYEVKKGGPPPTGAEKVLNDLPFEEALSLYNQHVRRAS